VDRSGAGWLESQVNLEALKSRFGFEPDNGPAALDMIEFIADAIAPAIVNLATQLDMDLVVLGGVISAQLGSRLTDAVQKKADCLSINPIRIEMPGSAEPGVLGAAALAAESVLDDILNSREGA
jgi:predicted NBD/HSP70 family sugar kinase